MSQNIAHAYGIEVEDISEIFSEISPGDYFSYNTYYGRLTLFDSETLEKVTIDIAEGLFDTVENSFQSTPEEAKDKISTTLARINGSRERGHYIDQILNYIDENGLSAFELFWDYETISVNNREYSAWNTRRYWVSIHTGDIIQMIWSPRSAEDYENLIVRSNYNIHSLWRPQFMRNPVTWTTLCWATARVFADRIGARWTPSSTWYAFNQFKMMPEPKAWQVPNSVRQINKNYNMWLGEITSFLQNIQTQVAQIYLDAAGSYSE